MGNLSRHFRCIPAASSICFLVLFLIAFGDLNVLLPHRHRYDQSNANAWAAAALLAVRWVVATIMICVQTLACAYPLRLCWATFCTTREIGLRAGYRWNIEDKAQELSPRAIASPPPGPIRHAIIIPSYKEDVDTLRDTLSVLASHRSAQRRYDIFLAMEQLDPSAEKVAAVLTDAFQGRFRGIQHSIHPAGIPGEAQGKSSNVSWAARKVGDKYRGDSHRENVIITVMDADTRLLPSYFSQVARGHREEQRPQSTRPCLYMPPIAFDRNARKVPSLVRMADLLWCGAALSGIYPGSSIAPPASVYSVPLALAELVGGWDTGPEAIGEDLHMFLKCFFATRGELRLKPIYSPASQCNACSEERGMRGFVDSIRARWKQAVRHMWGSLDTGYAIKQGLMLLWEGGLLAGLRSGKFLRFLLLYHRLFEAHFLPLLVPFNVLSSIIYPWFNPPVTTPATLLFAFRATEHLRNVSFFIVIFWFYLYEHFHWLCVRLREIEMRKVGLFDAADFSRRQGSRYWLDWVGFPVAGVLFGAAPAVVAQFSHLWTDSLVYQVTAKPAGQGTVVTVPYSDA